MFGKRAGLMTIFSRDIHVLLFPVDGNWTPWSAWTECDKKCGGGMMSRSRECAAPYPTPGGRGCEGVLKERQECNVHKCPGDT